MYVFLTIWFHVNEKGPPPPSKIWSGDKVDGYYSTTVGVNNSLTDGQRYNGRTTDARVMAVSLLCSSTKQSHLAIGKKKNLAPVQNFGLSNGLRLHSIPVQLHVTSSLIALFSMR